ncbi:MAG: DUF2652 domain-containing protein [Bacteroidales bacterium]|nr:DUF2652 domain-containing protein [Bacteroidales bacterium]
MLQSKQTFIFIPDISGFSKFVNQTAIDHSKHIISELLELIIDSDDLGLSVSEVEGDAILFYKDHIPEVKDILQQSEKTFINFQNYLLHYETERICRCGACETASKLSLKFIVHSGHVQRIKIKEHTKLHGPDVILAHRLLKNKIVQNEYVLFTDNFKNALSNTSLAQHFIWMQLMEGFAESENGEKIKYSYILPQELFKFVKKPEKITIPELSPRNLKLEVVINKSVDNVYDIFTNLSRKMEWDDNIRDIIPRDDKINQAGSVHTCVIDDGPLDIQALGRVEDEHQIVYAERIDDFSVFREIVRVYTFEKHEGHTHVKLELEFKLKSDLLKIFRPFFKNKLLKQSQANLNKLKKFSVIT